VVWQGAAVIGPAVAGIILAVWGLSGSFNINVGSDFVSIVAILLVRVPALSFRQAGRSGWSDVREGLAHGWRSERVRVLLMSIAVVTFLSRPYSQLMPAFARDVFKVGPEGLGWMLTVPALGTIAAGVAITAIRRISLVRSFLILSAAMGGALVGFCATRSFPLALGFLFVIGGCSTATNTLINTLIQENVEERLRGRTMSLFMASTWGMWRLGSLPVGLAAEAWGSPLAVGAAAVVLLGCLVPLARDKALHRAEAAPARGSPPSTTPELEPIVAS
jgi:MFS family permease